MKPKKQNLGKVLSRDELKQIKAGNASFSGCSTGQWVRCDCGSSPGFWCGEATSNGESIKDICLAACISYGFSTGQGHPGTFCGDPTCTP